MPSASFSHTATAPVAIERAFEALQEASTWGAIGGVGEIRDASHDPDGALTGYRFTAEVGGARYPGTATVTRSTPPTDMEVAVDTPEVGATIRVALSRSGQATDVTVDLSVRSKGFLSTLAFPVISNAIGSGLPASVTSFAEGLA
jgi:hypothetical protein